MNIVLLGKEGQVGWELQRALAPLGKLIALGRKEADLTNPQTLTRQLLANNPQIIINAAAYTQVDQAESEAEQAFQINAEAMYTLCEIALQQSACLIHYSTDYVFDGKKTSPYLEEDIAQPLNIYGQSKLSGENIIQERLKKYFIFRTSWVFSNRRRNFIKTILNLARERTELSIVDDQIGTPTSAALIADITALCLYTTILNRTQNYGLYHLTSAGETSWYRYAQFIIDYALKKGITLKLLLNALKPISSQEYTSPAPRPAYSCLNTEKLTSHFKLELPHWSAAVTRTLDELFLLKEFE